MVCIVKIMVSSFHEFSYDTFELYLLKYYTQIRIGFMQVEKLPPPPPPVITLMAFGNTTDI